MGNRRSSRAGRRSTAGGLGNRRHKATSPRNYDDEEYDSRPRSRSRSAGRQRATYPPKKQNDNLTLYLVGGGVGLVLLIVLFVSMSSGPSNQRDNRRTRTASSKPTNRTQGPSTRTSRPTPSRQDAIKAYNRVAQELIDLKAKFESGAVDQDPAAAERRLTQLLGLLDDLISRGRDLPLTSSEKSLHDRKYALLTNMMTSMRRVMSKAAQSGSEPDFNDIMAGMSKFDSGVASLKRDPKLKELHRRMEQLGLLKVPLK